MLVFVVAVKTHAKVTLVAQSNTTTKSSVQPHGDTDVLKPTIQESIPMSPSTDHHSLMDICKHLDFIKVFNNFIFIIKKKCKILC